MLETDDALFNLRHAFQKEKENGELLPIDEQIMAQAKARIAEIRATPRTEENIMEVNEMESLRFMIYKLIKLREEKIFYLAQDGLVPVDGVATKEEILLYSVFKSIIKDYREVMLK